MMVIFCSWYEVFVIVNDSNKPLCADKLFQQALMARSEENIHQCIQSVHFDSSDEISTSSYWLVRNFTT